MYRQWNSRQSNNRQSNRERGNAAFVSVGLVAAIFGFVLILGTFIKLFVLREAAGMAADAGALAASKALEEVFVSDVEPEAYAKLANLIRQITEDPLYKEGKHAEAILAHTVPSGLRDELLLGKRGRSISLDILLRYKPFYSEQAIGLRLVESFERHFEGEIEPEINHYVEQNMQTTVHSVSFPVYSKIEVVAERKYLSGGKELLRFMDPLYVRGRGHVLHIRILDEHQIRYDFSGSPPFRKRFEADR